MDKTKRIKRIIKYGMILCIIMIFFIFGINAYVKTSTNKQIITENEYSRMNDVDCILVLGAGVWGDTPSPVLEDRLLEAIHLYKSGVSNKIIMTGDHGRKEYDEVNVMKKFAMDKGIPSEDIFMDHAGFSTYESIYRARDIFEVKKVIIVTQKYHLYRALYIANQLGLEAYGVGADPRQYVGQSIRELREILARDKDFVKCIFKPEPTYLGDTIPVSSNGNLTNDKPIYSTSKPQVEIHTTIAYANWIDSDVAFESDENCLNLNKYVFSDYPRLPTFKFDTKLELDEFKNKYKDVLTMDQGYHEVASFNEVTANYDDDFFRNHSLILTHKEARSDSFRYEIGEVKKDNGVLIMKVVKTNHPEVYTDDMPSWFLMAEVEKDYIKDCKEFDTQLWEGLSYTK